MLAVDIHVLDFVTRLFLRIAPNNTAWADSINEFLSSQGYQLQGQDPLRRQFGNALQWFNSLQDLTANFVDQVLSIARNYEEGGSEVSDAEVKTVEIAKGKEARESSEDDDSNVDSGSDQPAKKQLRIDSDQEMNHPSRPNACFTQKHNKRSYKDPPRQHPRTVFLLESDVKRWEEIVASLRPPKTMPKTAAGGEAREDGYELSLKVPNSVLDACEASFTAADGSREKASTQFFDSTALMAMLCRHDRVLWLVNMTSPGERQHYALALIDWLFKNLPSGFIVGLLYDISCSIHRSCVKWGFLDAYLSQLTFAISVFHAYGHGWACQCVYHPRKCDGFGLSDAYLHICGHHTRLYTLDSQVQYADWLSLLGIGNWLARKWRNTQTRRLEADTQVISSAKQDRYLREQWKSQLSSQTRPLPRQTKNAGRSAVEEAIRLRKVQDTLHDRVSALEDVLSDINSEDYQVAEVEGKLPDLRGKLAQVQAKLIWQEQLLGVVGQQQYRHLATSPFMALQMNAHALKQYNDRKVRTQTEDAVKRRDPGIQALARQYNILCHKMEELVRLKRAPRNAIAPQPIPLKELFDLDVDDVIWQDVGLDASGDIENPPAWLTDEDVKSGIKGILLRDRCDEELRRLKHECIALYHWLSEEWQVVNACIEAATNLDLVYQLQERRRCLIKLGVTWRNALQGIPQLYNVSDWGLSASELSEAEQDLDEEKLEAVEETEEYIEMEDEFSDFDEDDLDIGLVEWIDALEDGELSYGEEDLDDVDNFL
ncbi:hypothetical protein DFH05DRAFT_1529806 [Lentinula detonsa]|uniref:CxC1-like cysteine cluster associated with KDZ transposases domain-containing protein n=1 Tax=Lentinula detonsa TaxID=2804962 RepID=A0A9W8NS98_9AGAR|nr:hypothetical protein DFH05DRAFT_1529806 [Lentinula detonsa]